MTAGENKSHTKACGKEQGNRSHQKKTGHGYTQQQQQKQKKTEKTTTHITKNPRTTRNTTKKADAFCLKDEARPVTNASDFENAHLDLHFIIDK